MGPPVTSACASHDDAAAGIVRPGGPIPQLGLGNTYLGLTRDGPGVEQGHPERLYPTGLRSYLRTVPADDAQAAAAVVVAHDAGARRTFAVYDGTPTRQGSRRCVPGGRGARGALLPRSVGAMGSQGTQLRALAARVRAAPASRRGLRRRPVCHEQRPAG